MPDKAWKKYERRIARMFGTERIPVTGERDGADAETEMFVLQMKDRKGVPITPFQWVERVAAKAGGKGKVGVLVLKRPGMADLDSIVVMRLRDFLDLNVGC